MKVIFSAIKYNMETSSFLFKFKDLNEVFLAENRSSNLIENILKKDVFLLEYKMENQKKNKLGISNKIYLLNLNYSFYQYNIIVR